ncbi:MAG: trehalose-phosphatase [Chloroflexi bacterium RBG_13_50_21]|nr:MAG: trehalose-phosphatase [Chloroflexi bacterium RBG_13_50_21]
MRFESEAELNQWVSKAERLWLFLDYDGTLVKFSRTPDIIVPDTKVIDLIKRLAEKSRIRLAIVSGRRLRDIQTLVPVQGIYIAGTYGIEVQTPEGERIQREDYALIRPYLERLKPHWEEIIDGHKDFFLEDKGWSLALHARFAPEKEATRVISSLHQTLDQELITDEYRLIKHKKFLEVSSAKAHKGKTVSFLLNSFPLQDARLVYIGDDDNDAEAFETIHSFGGIAISAAQYFGYVRSSGGDYVLKSPKAVRKWLENLIKWF